MRVVIRRWAARWRGLSQKHLRRLLLGSIVLHIGIGVYAVAELPLFPIRPICRDGSIDYDTPRLWVEGRLASDYLNAFERRFSPRMMKYEDGVDMVYVTLAQALDWSDIEIQSDVAFTYLLRARLGNEAYADYRDGRTSIAGLNPDSWPSCVLIRAFATADGVWSKRGPEPFKLP